MEKQEFTITIDAAREKVWNILWSDATYRQWTSVFSESSRAETDWKKGSKVLFLDAKDSGLVSVIADNQPNEFMSFKHLGIVKDGVEDLESAENQGWSGALENYTLRAAQGKTELTVEMGVTGMSDGMRDYFLKTWPLALDKLKDIAEEK